MPRTTKQIPHRRVRAKQAPAGKVTRDSGHVARTKGEGRPPAAAHPLAEDLAERLEDLLEKTLPYPLQGG